MKTLTLKPGAFNTELLPIVGTHKIGWSGEDHIRFVEALLPHLTDDAGNPIEPSEEQLDRLRLIFRPTEETQRKVLKHTLAELDLELDAKTERALVLVMNMTQFADYLAKAKRPGTETTFIVKEKKRGVKKGLFEDLIAAPATVATDAGDEIEQPTAEEAEQPPQVMTPKPAAKPTAAKPTIKR